MAINSGGASVSGPVIYQSGPISTVPDTVFVETSAPIGYASLGSPTITPDVMVPVPDPQSTLVQGRRVFAATSNPLGRLVADAEQLKGIVSSLQTRVEQG